VTNETTSVTGGKNNKKGGTRGPNCQLGLNQAVPGWKEARQRREKRDKKKKKKRKTVAGVGVTKRGDPEHVKMMPEGSSKKSRVARREKEKTGEKFSKTTHDIRYGKGFKCQTQRKGRDATSRKKRKKKKGPGGGRDKSTEM